MSVINVVNLTFGYEGSFDNVFENASFQIDTNWKLGFVGRNGRGKTTFLNLLLEKHEYSGSIIKSVNFEYFPFEVEDKTKLTIDIVGDDWQIFRELSLLSVDPEVLYRPFNTLSNGEQTKVLLASLFIRENSFLLIDEPTNHLDVKAREIVAEYLNEKKGFILVSHDRAFLDICVDHILSINKSNIEVMRGNFSTWYHNKELQDNYEIAENQKLKKDIKRLNETAKEKARWSEKNESTKIGFNPRVKEKNMGSRAYIGAKTKSQNKRVKAIEKRISNQVSDKEKLLKNIEEADNLKLFPEDFHAKRLVEFNDLTINYGSYPIFSELTFTINRGDRIALSGKNGSGKSSIIKLICGEDIPHEGGVFIAKNLNVSYVHQDTEHLSGFLADYEVKHGLDVSLFRAILCKLDFSREQFDKNISNFSAGQKKKVLLAHSLCQRAHIYIWDEPLNYIDVLSRIQIENLIKEYEPTLLFVEHDKTFCENISTKIINL